MKGNTISQNCRLLRYSATKPGQGHGTKPQRVRNYCIDGPPWYAAYR